MKLELLKHVPVSDVFALAFARGANRLLAKRGFELELLFDATSGKEVGRLPKESYTSAIDPTGTLAAVTSAGKTVAGRHEWNVSLWDLAKGKKIGAIAKNHPDDNVSPEAFGNTRILALRKKKNTHSFCLYDRAGKPIAEHRLGKVDLPFHGAMSADERIGAHAYFTGAAHIVDLATGKSQKLEGGSLRIGRQHDKGITSLELDSNGEHVMYVSPGKVQVWSTRTRKSVAGKWTSAAVSDAFFFAGGLVVVHSSSQDSTITFFPLTGKSAPRVLSVGKHSMLFSSAGDDRHIACAGYTGFDVSAEKSISVWDVTTGKRVARAPAPKGMKAVGALAACADRVAVGDRKGGLALFALA